MNKRIPGIAVAGILAAPAAAFAQSNVAISGVLKGGFESLKLGNYRMIGFSPTTGGRRVGLANNSQRGVVDDSSYIRFNVRENLGDGLAAIGQLTISVNLSETTGPAQPSENIVQGNSHLGLQSRSWGRIFFGRQDLHYFNTSGTIGGKNSLRADSISLLAFAGAYAAPGRTVNGGTTIANATRTQNVVHYTTPNWRGFTGIIAYSSNPFTTERDIGNSALQSIRKGNAWHVNPNYSAVNWQVGYSHWRSKPDGGIPVSVPTNPLQFFAADQRAHRLYGNYTFDFDLRVGLAWDNSKLEGNTGLNDGTTLSKRTAWSIPFQYSFMERHHIVGHYTWAKSDRANFANGLNTKANMRAIGYSYDLSRQTSIGITYARINNQSGAGYNFFTSAGLGLGVAGLMAGEDPRMFGTTVRHAF